LPLPPPSPSPLLRRFFKPFTDTASSLSLLIVRPFLSLARDFGIGLSSPSPAALVGDIEENRIPDRDGEDKETTESCPDPTLEEAVVKVEGIKSFLHFNYFLLRRAFGTFRGFFVHN
jgi:hypothetical protein